MPWTPHPALRSRSAPDSAPSPLGDEVSTRLVGRALPDQREQRREHQVGGRRLVPGAPGASTLRLPGSGPGGQGRRQRRTRAAAGASAAKCCQRSWHALARLSDIELANAKGPALQGLPMRRRGLEPPPGYPGPGPQPGNSSVISVLCVHIVQIVQESGRNGRNGRSGCCHGCCHELAREGLRPGSGEPAAVQLREWTATASPLLQGCRSERER